MFTHAVFQRLRVSLNRLVLALLTWYLCACALYYGVLQPKWRDKALENLTQICILQNSIPTAVSWDDWQKHRQPLCLTELNEQADSLSSISVRLRDDILTVRTTNDSPSDPWESEYRLNTDGSITPLRYRFGGMMAWFVSAIFGAVLAVIVFRLLVWRLGKTRYHRFFHHSNSRKQPDT
ncbi:MAG: hypothetical protein Q4A62_00605 [Eikenella sp.]|nr:hypothetical protein [Eikenella sp.]